MEESTVELGRSILLRHLSTYQVHVHEGDGDSLHGWQPGAATVQFINALQRRLSPGASGPAGEPMTLRLTGTLAAPRDQRRVVSGTEIAPSPASSVNGFDIAASPQPEARKATTPSAEALREVGLDAAAEQFIHAVLASAATPSAATSAATPAPASASSPAGAHPGNSSQGTTTAPASHPSAPPDTGVWTVEKGHGFNLPITWHDRAHIAAPVSSPPARAQPPASTSAAPTIPTHPVPLAEQAASASSADERPAIPTGTPSVPGASSPSASSTAVAPHPAAASTAPAATHPATSPDPGVWTIEKGHGLNLPITWRDRAHIAAPPPPVPPAAPAAASTAPAAIPAVLPHAPAPSPTFAVSADKPREPYSPALQDRDLVHASPSAAPVLAPSSAIGAPQPQDLQSLIHPSLPPHQTVTLTPATSARQSPILQDVTHPASPPAAAARTTAAPAVPSQPVDPNARIHDLPPSMAHAAPSTTPPAPSNLHSSAVPGTPTSPPPLLGDFVHREPASAVAPHAQAAASSAAAAPHAAPPAPPAAAAAPRHSPATRDASVDRGSTDELSTRLLRRFARDMELEAERRGVVAWDY